MNLVAIICVAGLLLAAVLWVKIQGAFGGGFASSWEGVTQGPERPAEDSLGVRALALPIAFSLGWLLKDVWWGLGFFFHVGCHEVGHSLMAWLGGYWSFPVIVGIALNSAEPSVLVIAGMFSLIGAGLWLALRRRSAFLFLLCAALAAGQAYFTFKADRADWEQWMLFGGCAGEFALPALIILGFHQKLPPRLRWDFFRYPLLAAAMCSLVSAAHFWGKAGEDPDRRILHGTSFSETKESGHDMVRLNRVHGWTPRLIADRYAALGRLCALGAVAAYLWFLAAALLRDPEDVPDGAA